MLFRRGCSRDAAVYWRLCAVHLLPAGASSQSSSGNYKFPLDQPKTATVATSVRVGYANSQAILLDRRSSDHKRIMASEMMLENMDEIMTCVRESVAFWNSKYDANRQEHAGREQEVEDGDDQDLMEGDEDA